MSFNIVHIVSSLDRINFGIWNAAIFGSSYLHDRFSFKSEVWICQEEKSKEIHLSIPVVWVGDTTARQTVIENLRKKKLTPQNTLVVTHGCWLMPTRLGSKLKDLGFRWLYVPHGMLEPWSLKQGRIKKLLYFYFYERSAIKKATRIRAVSEEEQKNLLKKLGGHIDLVENGVQVSALQQKNADEEIYLFMARLHHKKGIFPLVKAWHQVMANVKNKTLVIAGPDEGELNKIQPFLGNNIQYVGAIYGEEKIALLKRAHYFVLPSFSEGFPTSVLEAMSYGLIPLISDGCNFNQVFSEGLGYKVEPDPVNIGLVLQDLKEKEFDKSLSLKNHQYILNHYSEARIGEKLFNLYSEMMNSAFT